MNFQFEQRDKRSLEYSIYKNKISTNGKLSYRTHSYLLTPVLFSIIMIHNLVSWHSDWNFKVKLFTWPWIEVYVYRFILLISFEFSIPFYYESCIALNWIQLNYFSYVPINLYLFEWVVCMYKYWEHMSIKKILTLTLFFSIIRCATSFSYKKMRS